MNMGKTSERAQSNPAHVQVHYSLVSCSLFENLWFEDGNRCHRQVCPNRWHCVIQLNCGILKSIVVLNFAPHLLAN